MDEGPVTPRFIDMKSEVDSQAVYPEGDAHHVAGQAEVSGASPIDDPEVRFTELVGVEEGGQDEDAVDYSLANDPIISNADLEGIRANRAGVRAQVMDPLHPIPDEEPHSTYDYNHNLIVRPRGVGWMSRQG